MSYWVELPNKFIIIVTEVTSFISLIGCWVQSLGLVCISLYISTRGVYYRLSQFHVLLGPTFNTNSERLRIVLLDRDNTRWFVITLGETILSTAAIKPNWHGCSKPTHWQLHHDQPDTYPSITSGQCDYNFTLIISTSVWDTRK